MRETTAENGYQNDSRNLLLLLLLISPRQRKLYSVAGQRWRRWRRLLKHTAASAFACKGRELTRVRARAAFVKYHLQLHKRTRRWGWRFLGETRVNTNALAYATTSATSTHSHTYGGFTAHTRCRTNLYLADNRLLTHTSSETTIT